MPEPSPASLRRRAALVLGAIGLVGFGGGALTNLALARLLALPEGAEVPAYADASVAEPAARDGVGGQREGAVAEATPKAPPRPRALSEKTYSDIIVRRNIFDSTAVYDPNAAKASDASGECRSDATVRLLATVVAEVPTYSSALISLGAARDAKADGFAMGDEVSGEGRIVLIEQKKVCMDGGTCICIGGDTAKTVASGAGAKAGDAEGGVERITDTKYAVDSSLIEDSMNNMEQLASQVRVAPHKGADGQVDGYRLSAIRRGSLFDKLGIKNGDIVHTVNGNSLTSTNAAMQAYESLRNERSFNFEITRRNQRQTLEYEVR